LIVALAGGIEVEPLLGSRGTCLPGAFGGLEGRALRKGDVLPLGMSRGGRPVTYRVETLDHVELALVPGPSSPAIGDAAWETLLSSRYRLARETDRVGARLDGPKLPRLPAPELGPQPMSRGTMQITHDGTPVVLGPDCPTTGGYPVIGVLDRASQAALGRLRIGGAITVKRARIA
jgi:allophanate hydrolase subunit 2